MWSRNRFPPLIIHHWIHNSAINDACGDGRSNKNLGETQKYAYRQHFVTDLWIKVLTRACFKTKRQNFRLNA